MAAERHLSAARGFCTQKGNIVQLSAVVSDDDAGQIEGSLLAVRSDVILPKVSF